MATTKKAAVKKAAAKAPAKAQVIQPIYQQSRILQLITKKIN